MKSHYRSLFEKENSVNTDYVIAYDRKSKIIYGYGKSGKEAIINSYRTGGLEDSELFQLGFAYVNEQFIEVIDTIGGDGIKKFWNVDSKGIGSISDEYLSKVYPYTNG